MRKEISQGNREPWIARQNIILGSGSIHNQRIIVLGRLSGALCIGLNLLFLFLNDKKLKEKKNH